MAPKRVFPLGTVSHGTLRSEDLLESFADALESLGKGNIIGQGALSEDDKALVIEAREWDGEDDQRGMDILDSLTEALSERAPDYCYFGAIEGDGSDFGFWIDSDRLAEAREFGELPSGDELPDDSEAATLGMFLVVSDHGNGTFYANIGGQFVEVWSCV